MSLIKSISGIRGTIGGRPGEGLSPLDVVKFTSAFGTFLQRRNNGKRHYCHYDLFHLSCYKGDPSKYLGQFFWDTLGWWNEAYGDRPNDWIADTIEKLK